jgi:hypothetical protein
MRRLPAAIAAVVVALTASLAARGAEPEAPAASPAATVETSAAESVPALIERMARDDFSGLDASRRVAAMGEAAVPDLIRATEHQVPRVRYWSIAALSGIGSDSALPAIVKCLNDPDALVRAVAIWHLGGWYERPEVREAVLKKLQDPDPFVKGWAMKLIQAQHDRRAVEPVRALLKEQTPEVRYDALHTLSVLEGPDVLDTLTKILREDESAIVREGALRCCTVVSPPTPRTAEVLIAGLRDKDATVRKAAIGLLRKGFGQGFAFDPSGEPLDREKGARQWQDWYDANKARLGWNEERRRFDVAENQPVPAR